MAQATTLEFAASVKNKLTSEFSDLYAEVREAEQELALFGSEEFLQDALPRANDLIVNPEFHILVTPVEAVQGTSSTEIKPTRSVGEAVTSAWTSVAQDDRGVALLCIATASHDHNWGEYPALNPRSLGR